MKKAVKKLNSNKRRERAVFSMITAGNFDDERARVLREYQAGSFNRAALYLSDLLRGDVHPKCRREFVQRVKDLIEDARYYRTIAVAA